MTTHISPETLEAKRERARHSRAIYLVKTNDGEFIETSDPVDLILNRGADEIEYVLDLSRSDMTSYWLTEAENVSNEDHWDRGRIRRYYERG